MKAKANDVVQTAVFMRYSKSLILKKKKQPKANKQTKAFEKGFIYLSVVFAIALSNIDSLVLEVLKVWSQWSILS